MAFGDGYKYDKATINANASTSAGVYALFKKDTWIYFGEAINIRDRLVQHIDRDYKDNPDIVAEAPTGFCYELVAGGKEARVAVQDAHIRRNANPHLCNRKLG